MVGEIGGTRRGRSGRVHRRVRDQAGRRLHRRRIGAAGQAHGPRRRDHLGRQGHGRRQVRGDGSGRRHHGEVAGRPRCGDRQAPGESNPRPSGCDERPPSGGLFRFFHCETAASGMPDCSRPQPFPRDAGEGGLVYVLDASPFAALAGEGARKRAMRATLPPLAMTARMWIARSQPPCRQVDARARIPLRTIPRAPRTLIGSIGGASMQRGSGSISPELCARHDGCGATALGMPSSAAGTPAARSKAVPAAASRARFAAADRIGGGSRLVGSLPNVATVFQYVDRWPAQPGFRAVEVLASRWPRVRWQVDLGIPAGSRRLDQCPTANPRPQARDGLSSTCAPSFVASHSIRAGRREHARTAGAIGPVRAWPLSPAGGGMARRGARHFDQEPHILC